MRRSAIIAWMVSAAVACGGTTVIDGSEETSSGSGAGSGSPGSSSAGGDCLRCGSVFGKPDFSVEQVCAGEEVDRYQALLACGCQHCEEPCTGPPNVNLLCQGGFADGRCDSCLYEHCLEQRTTCVGCVPCESAFTSEDFYSEHVCPGEETEQYEALIACGCQQCEVPCTGPPNSHSLCRGGHVDEPCGSCLYDRCLEARTACLR